MTDGASVLIVDDDLLTLEILSEFLRDEGYSLFTATGGVRACQILEEHGDAIDCVILDRRMPDMDGLDVLRRVRNDVRFNTLPVIMQTAAMSRTEVIEGLEAGAYYYLTKPLDESVLCPIVRTAIEDRMRYRELQEQQRRSVQVLGLMRRGFFRFRTMVEAHNLAVFLSNACPDPHRVVTGLSELLINAVEHGNLGISYAEKSALLEKEAWSDEVERRLALPENRPKFVEVHFENEDQHIRIRIKDQGVGFDWEPFLEIDAARAFDSHGRGIAMARHFSFDEVEYLGGGSEVVVTIHGT
jgi:CheY-like chemotaxis protein